MQFLGASLSSKVSGTFLAGTAGVVAATKDYVAGSTGSAAILSPGANTGDVYSNLQAYKTGGTAFGNLAVQSGGGNLGLLTATFTYGITVGATIGPATDNTYSLGAASTGRWANIYSVNSVTVGSDRRDKSAIIDSPLGLDFVLRLRPVAYRLRHRAGRDETAGRRQHFGMIAQEVKAALPHGVDFGGWVLADLSDPESRQALRYEEFISPLIKAVQELAQHCDRLEAELAALRASP